MASGHASATEYFLVGLITAPPMVLLSVLGYRRMQETGKVQKIPQNLIKVAFFASVVMMHSLLAFWAAYPPVYVIIEYASNLGYTLYTYGLTMITWITMSICHTISSKKIKPEGLPRWMKHCFKYSIVVWSVALVPVIGMAYYTDRYIYVMAYQTALLAATWLVFALSIRTYRRLHFLLTARREKMKEHSTPISILKPSVSINPRDTVTGEKNSSTTNNSDKGASSKKRYDEGSIVMRRFRNILLLQLATTVILSLLLYAAHFMSDDWTRFKLPDRDLPFFEGDKWPTQTSFRGYLVMIFCTVMFIFMSWRQPTDIEEDALSRRGMMSHAASGPSFSPERRDRRDRRPSERKNRRSMSALPSPSRLANDDSPSTDTRPLDRVSTPSRGEAPNLIRGEMEILRFPSVPFPPESSMADAEVNLKAEHEAADSNHIKAAAEALLHSSVHQHSRALSNASETPTDHLSPPPV